MVRGLFQRAVGLQWGRSPEAAEIVSERAFYNPRDQLQWGRSPEAAEIDWCAHRVQHPGVLQWGRSPEAAEITETVNDLDGYVSLQWGRSPEAAEIVGSFCLMLSSSSMPVFERFFISINSFLDGDDLPPRSQ